MPGRHRRNPHINRAITQETLHRRKLPLRRKPPNGTGPDGAIASAVGARCTAGASITPDFSMFLSFMLYLQLIRK